MPSASSIPVELPDDINALKALIRQQQDELDTQKERYQEQLEAQKKQYQEQLERLQEAINQLLQRQYGPSSEKAPDEQMRLFNEPEQLADEAADEEEEKRRPSRSPRIRAASPDASRCRITCPGWRWCMISPMRRSSVAVAAS